MALKTEAANCKDRTTGTNSVRMEHRHFAKIAAIIAELDGGTYGRDDIASVFASALADTNPNFNRNRFLQACSQDQR